MYSTQLDISNFSGLDDSILGKYSNLISKTTLAAPIRTNVAINPDLKQSLTTTGTVSTSTTTSRPTLSAPTTYTAPAPAPAPAPTTTYVKPTVTYATAPKTAINPDLKPTLATATYSSPPQVITQPIAQPIAQPILQPVIPVAPIGQAVLQPVAQPSVVLGGGGGFSGGGYSGGGSGGATSGGDLGESETGEVATEAGQAGGGDLAKKVLVEEKSNKMKILGLLIGAAGGYFYAKQNNKSLVAFTLIGSALGLGIGYYIEKNK